MSFQKSRWLTRSNTGIKRVCTVCGEHQLGNSKSVSGRSWRCPHADEEAHRLKEERFARAFYLT